MERLCDSKGGSIIVDDIGYPAWKVLQFIDLFQVNGIYVLGNKDIQQVQ